MQWECIYFERNHVIFLLILVNLPYFYNASKQYVTYMSFISTFGYFAPTDAMKQIILQVAINFTFK